MFTGRLFMCASHLCQLNDKRFISHIIDLSEDGH